MEAWATDVLRPLSIVAGAETKEILPLRNRSVSRSHFAYVISGGKHVVMVQGRDRHWTGRYRQIALMAMMHGYRRRTRILIDFVGAVRAERLWRPYGIVSVSPRCGMWARGDDRRGEPRPHQQVPPTCHSSVRSQDR